MNKLLLSVLLLNFAMYFGQIKSDSLPLISYENQVILRANIDTNIEDYVLSNKESNLKIALALNSKIKTSLAIDYQFVSLSFSFTPAFLPGNNEEDLKGKSAYTDIKLQFFPGRFLQQIHYRNSKGFYVDNTQDFIEDWQKGKDPYIQIPNFRVQTFGGSTSYFFKKEFSMKSLLYQREWQTASSGTFVPSLEYDLTYFSNKSDDDKSKERQFNISTNFAYYYNWVIAPKVNISPYVAIAIGGKFSKFKNQDPQEITGHTYFTYQYSAGIQSGYNAAKLFFGSKMNFSSYNYSDKSSDDIKYNHIYGLLYIGYRFAPPKKVEKLYEKVHEKIPIL